MTVTLYSMDNADIIAVKRGMSPRQAHKFMKWLKQSSAYAGVYWTCWPDDLSK